MHKSRKPSVFDRRNIKMAKQQGRTQFILFPEAPPDANPQIGPGITTLPIAVVRDPASERLLMRKSEPPPNPPAEPEKAPRVAKKKVSAKKAAAPKPRKKATKPAAKRVTKTTTQIAAKTAPRKAPVPRKPKTILANDTGTPTAPIALVKDVAPAIPPIMAPPPTTPLPRNAAVTAWRKNGPIDVLAYWVRSTAKSLLARFKTRKRVTAKAKPPVVQAPAVQMTATELDQLRAENALLRERIEQLLDSRMERLKDA